MLVSLSPRPARPFLVSLALLLLAIPAAAQQAPALSVNAGGGLPSPGVLPARPVPGLVLAEVHLRDLPSADTIWSVIETADPFVVVDRIANGGLYLGEHEWFGSHGSSGTQSSFLMDGLDLTDPERTGTPLMQLDREYFQAVGVAYSFLAPELGGAGTTLVLVPRAAGSRWAGQLRAGYLPHQLQAENARDGAPSIARFGTTGGAQVRVGGPVAERLGVFLTGRGVASRRFERGDQTPLDSRLVSGFLHATASLSENHRLRVVAAADRAAHPFYARARFPLATVRATDNSRHLHATYERVTPRGTAFSAAAGYQRSETGGPSDGHGTVTGVIERILDGPVPELVVPPVGPRGRYGAVFQLNPGFGLDRLGRLSAGLSLNHAFSQPAIQARALVGELVDGLPARVWDFESGSGEVRRHATELAAWVNGQVALGSRLALDLGARLDWTEARSEGRDEMIRWRTVLPRGLLQWQITDGGGINAFLGYGLYRHRLPLGYLAYGDPGAPAGLVYRWDDRNGDRWLQPGEVGRLVAAAGPGARSYFESRIDPDLEAPIARQLVLGFDLRMGERWRWKTTGFERRDVGLVAPVNEGVTLADYRPIDIEDRGADFLNPIDDRLLTVYDRLPSSFGRDRDVLTNPDGHDAHYIGVDVALERVFDGRWHMLFGAAAHRSDGLAGNRGFHVNENDVGVLGEAFQNPNALTYTRGRLFFERGYIIKWSGGVVTASGLHLGAVARYQDGQHFARMVIVPDLAQGPEAVQAYTRGHSRFTFTFTLDARIEQAFRVGGARLGLMVEAFNLLNTANEVEEDPVTTRLFRASTVVQPPRAIRFGLRYDF
ncbi:MAG TPA: TonB-dependent receptor [Vicinamibacterales bacterium]|nr:TonB-dependent receptor [Acidobacteriota bacterium]HOC17222.1 TonB-dependent receptor [Vicinamibacterales bacterium]